MLSAATSFATTGWGCGRCDGGCPVGDYRAAYPRVGRGNLRVATEHRNSSWSIHTINVEPQRPVKYQKLLYTIEFDRATWRHWHIGSNLLVAMLGISGEIDLLPGGNMENLKESHEELVRSLKVELSSVEEELRSLEIRYAGLRHKRNSLDSAISIVSENCRPTRC